jgi:hypothetical protein
MYVRRRGRRSVATHVVKRVQARAQALYSATARLDAKNAYLQDRGLEMTSATPSGHLEITNPLKVFGRSDSTCCVERARTTISKLAGSSHTCNTGVITHGAHPKLLEHSFKSGWFHDHTPEQQLNQCGQRSISAYE